MSELHQDLTYIVGGGNRANLLAKYANQHADRLEREATEKRKSAVNLQMDEFEKAGLLLQEAATSGKYDNTELLRAQLELRGIDPILLERLDKVSQEELVEAFTCLVPETPVLNLGEGKWSSGATGVVTGLPTNFRIQPATIYRNDSKSIPITNASYSPTSHFEVPLKTINQDGQPTDLSLEMSDYSLRYGAIGREVIAALVAEATFTTERDDVACHPGTTSNARTLHALRLHIEELYQLGMNPIDTTALDNALDRAQEWQLARQRQQYRSRYNFPTGPLATQVSNPALYRE